MWCLLLGELRNFLRAFLDASKSTVQIPMGGLSLREKPYKALYLGILQLVDN